MPPDDTAAPQSPPSPPPGVHSDYAPPAPKPVLDRKRAALEKHDREVERAHKTEGGFAHKTIALGKLVQNALDDELRIYLARYDYECNVIKVGIRDARDLAHLHRIRAAVDAELIHKRRAIANDR